MNFTTRRRHYCHKSDSAFGYADVLAWRYFNITQRL